MYISVLPVTLQFSMKIVSLKIVSFKHKTHFSTISFTLIFKTSVVGLLVYLF